MRIRTRHLRSSAIYKARGAHTLWVTRALKPRDAFFTWSPYTRGGCFIWSGTIPGDEPLPYRQWVVEMKDNGAILAAYHQGE